MSYSPVPGHISPPPFDEGVQVTVEEEEQQEEFASSKQHLMDYVLRKEVIKRIRLEREAEWYLFMLKEKFDNAIDFLWKHYPTAATGDKRVTASIELNHQDKLFHCSVANSNASNRPVFPNNNLSHILDFSMTYGTKQNEHVITRGALGDALKQLASLPYTLMKEDEQQRYNEQWNYPTYFRFNGNKEYKAVLQVDKLNQRILATPILVNDGDKKVLLRHPLHVLDTEIQNTWPLIDKVTDPAHGYNYLDANRIADYCRKYLIFTTDVSFKIKIKLSYTSTTSAAEQIITIDSPATSSTISSKWINAPSIYSYTLEEFVNMLYAIHDKSKPTVYQIIRKFREWSRVPKSKVPDLDVPLNQFLASKNDSQLQKKIASLYLRLRTKGEITKSPDKLSLPYTIKDERRKALAARLAKLYHHIPLDESAAVYEVLHSVAKERDNASGRQLISYAYAIEVIAVPYFEQAVSDALDPDDVKSHYVAGAINYSVSPEDNIFAGYYTWYDKAKKKDGSSLYANSVKDILEIYNFVFRPYDSNKQTSKLPCVIAINLISPKLIYKSEGKSDVDVMPFRDTLPKVIAAVARRIKTFRAAGIDTTDSIESKETQQERQKRRERKLLEDMLREPSPPPPPTIYNIVHQVIRERVEQFRRGEPFKELETLDSIWYNPILPMFRDHGVVFDPGKSRETVKKYINEICEVEDVKRNDIGIMAAAWATMYYNGQFRAVNFADMKELAENGTDIIFIEKGGMVEALKDYADKYRIALVNSHGHLSEYAKELADAARKSGAHVAVVTDYDVAGLLIASKLDRSIPWLGINKQTIEYFDIPLPDPATKVYPSSERRRLAIPFRSKKEPIEKHKLQELQRDDPRFSPDAVDINWLWEKTETYYEGTKKKKRVIGNKIEIDAVKADQGSEGLWNYILEELGKRFPDRDYTRVIPAHVYTDVPEPPTTIASNVSASAAIKITSQLESYVKNRIEELTAQPRQGIKEELENYHGFIDDVDAKEDEIEKEIEGIVKEDEIINDIIPSIVSKAVKEAQAELSIQDILNKVATKANEAIKQALIKIDNEKGYGIMKALRKESLPAEEAASKRDPKIDTAKRG
jgi:hypothetical protein